MRENNKIISAILQAFVIIGFILGFNILFWTHYASLLISNVDIFVSLLIINVSFFVGLSSVYFYKDFINPISLYSLFIFFAGFSYLPISTKQAAGYSLFTQLLLLLSITSFLGGCIFHNSGKRIKFQILTKTSKMAALALVVITSVIVFFLEVSRLGYIPLFNLSAEINVYTETNENLIPFAHYLVLYMALVPAIAFSYFKTQKIGFVTFLTIGITAFFVIVNFLSRQSILLLFLSLFYSYIYYKKVSMLKTISIGVIIILMFLFVGNLRADSSDLQIVNEYLKGAANINKNVSLLETYITLYSSLNFSTLDDFVKNIVSENKLEMGIYTLKPLISFLFLDRLGIVSYDPEYDGFKALGTYALDPFLDFSFLGVIFINFAYGYLATNSYKNFVAGKNPLSIISWSVLSFCIIMSPFTNYYSNFFTWFAILLSIPLINEKFSNKC